MNETDKELFRRRSHSLYYLPRRRNETAGVAVMFAAVDRQQPAAAAAEIGTVVER